MDFIFERQKYYMGAEQASMIFEIFGKSSEIFGSVRKSSENGSKVIFRCFYDFLKFSENLRKSSEVFGNLRKTSETVQK